jgi:hypothetical protein
MSEQAKLELVQKDEILQEILGIKTSKKSTVVVSRYEFHEMLLDADDAVPPRALLTDAAPLPDTLAAPCEKSGKEARPKQSPPTASPYKLHKTGSDSTSSSPGDRESPKREAPPVRTPPARSAKQAKTSKHTSTTPPQPAGQRTLNFAPAAKQASAASSRKAPSDALNAAEPPRKKPAHVSSSSGGSRHPKVAEPATPLANNSHCRSRAAVPLHRKEQEVIDLCDSD